MAAKETKLDRPMGGLFLMTILTTIWTILAEYFFTNFDYKAVGFVLGGVIIYFIFSYITFYKQKANLPIADKMKDPKKE